MASFVKPDGLVVPPLNITAPAPILDLRGFNWGTVDEKLHGPQARQGGPIGDQQVSAEQVPLAATPLSRAPAASSTSEVKPLPTQLAEQIRGHGKEAPSPPEFPLTRFQGAYAGNGFNLIWRPKSNTDTSKLPIPPKVNAGSGDNVLELNLTLEQITFGPTIGKIPNRGLFDQPDIFLTGFPYLQTVQDVTDPSGLGNNPVLTDIHFEPGMWLWVPGAKFHPKDSASVVRMASIPHGTTINAQGMAPTFDKGTVLGGVAGPPVIDDIDTTPFKVGFPKSRLLDRFFQAMDAGNPEVSRVPQNLKNFVDNGTITTAFIKNPNLVLKKALEGMTVTETITFEVSTGPPTSKFNGGGTANISFLAGKQDPITTDAPDENDNPVAHAAFMTSKYWIERVEYVVPVPQTNIQSVLKLKPDMGKNTTAPTPEFLITTPPGGVPAATKIKVPGIQIQSSQIVNLNFSALSWPHVSVATLIPKDPQTFKMD